MSKSLKRSRIRPAGFTLIEALVTTAIIAMLSTTMTANYRSFTNNRQVKNTANQVHSDFMLVQEYALGLKPFPGAPTTGGYGWGINIKMDVGSATKYTIFADTQPDHRYNAAQDGTYQVVNLSAGDRITKMTVYADGNLNANTLDVVYEPPNPTVHFNVNGNPAAMIYSVTIILNSGRRIVVYPTGLVDARNYTTNNIVQLIPKNSGNRSCSDVCTDAGYSGTPVCLSIGTNAAADNNRYYRTSCSTLTSGACGTNMTRSASLVCFGTNAMWSNCRCN